MPLSRASRAPLALTAAVLTLLTAPCAAGAQQPGDSIVPIRITEAGALHTLRLRDGSSITGLVIAVEPDTVRVETSGGIYSISRAAIVRVREHRSSRAASTRMWPADPNATRLLFAPTGRMLRRGEGYFADHMLFLLSGAGGVSDRFTLGGGMSVLPLENFSENAFIVTPKLGLVAGEELNLATGALLGVVGSGGDPFGILYGVGTVGVPDASLTAGLGYGFAGGDLADEPAILLGGNLRLSRRVSFVTENYLLPGIDEPVVSYGLRFFGETLAADLAFINVIGENTIFPGIPFVGFAVHF